MPVVGSPGETTINFDENITQVSQSSIVWSTSGETNMTMTFDGASYEFIVTLNEGYIINSVTLSDSDKQLGSLQSVEDTKFTILAGSGGISQTITITSKLATSRKSIDLTTLPGWSSLSSGSHSITIVAKADGYRDSEPSAAVNVEKVAEVTLISFTIAGTSYQAEEGMTWAEWVESEYNTDGFSISGGLIYDNAGHIVATERATGSSTDEVSTNAIVEGKQYILRAGGGASN